ncbi:MULTISPECIES: FMN-binding negative transcriptional regulator [unclassified Microcoleus]|jgi:transcriptional regulator|uniref:FMN-binding negative transcriptional regulator n=1 Tax=unclassified Microcoleus TaxID=2642155 RepID=UPI001E05DDCF|nr:MULTISPECIES: FMN-binding negative transcriptional regulator [unclassified Microcoleus]MCC3441706.1 FMN-binding negative transcriptional regulator [Microcoleus sp. PH2017_03_ELD_O_A]MCC3467264.1 FMN-binding negative transcriptional regulator [Microcoleus sp. PH2017_06_SFM_O_A]TAE07771.1 MAG: FMN-binding negative transcriptional regulator [Oscillatoriales cyanobacterium]MCC3415069.1 FMN-binding negative transcriptional regulator [Microcoleus sp. PH2017_02_FOX_O_A]MCC3427359.1 FMN-binding neg
MYNPTAFQEDNIDKLVAFMRANSFATLVSSADGVPCASHIPLVITIEEDVVKLSGHLAKQNPQWQAFGSTESLAIFTGAHAYISPAQYEKHESVPTWNYIAVHAYGVPKIIMLNDSPKAMNTMINQMIDTYDVDYQSHWDGLSNQFREGMMDGIVGFEMAITRLEGKYKLSQNRSQADQKNVSDTLLQSSDPAARAVGVEMKQNLEAN